MTCYYGPGLQGPSELVACLPTKAGTESGCCLLGDTCLGGSACYNYDTGDIYQYGCTDRTYQDSSCPLKCAWNTSQPSPSHRYRERLALLTQIIASSPWVALDYYEDLPGVIDIWVCLSPENCNCDWQPTFGLVERPLPARGCKEMGLQARAALYAPSALAPYASLPASRNGSTGYYSPTMIYGTSSWLSTAVSGCQWLSTLHASAVDTVHFQILQAPLRSLSDT